jgi:hypothetical protein
MSCGVLLRAVELVGVTAGHQCRGYPVRTDTCARIGQTIGADLVRTIRSDRASPDVIRAIRGNSACPDVIGTI